MELLNEFDTTDPVSELLRVARVRSTVYCRSSMRAPWGFGVEAHGNPAFHVLTSGSCWLEIDGEPEQTALAAGDFVVLPAGPRHWLRDHPDTPATELEEILASTRLDKHRRLHHGGRGAQTGLLCGGFALDSGASHPMLLALPAMLVIRGSRGQPVPWLAATLAMLTAETASDAPGAEEVVARLADTLLTQALRLALVDLHASYEARVRALRDPQIAEAIALIHNQPERAWAVGELASEVALSRSELAARFRDLVGESVLRYVTRTRLARAAALLRTSDASLAQVAARTGYGTPFSFGRAFKRMFGIAPGAYRGQANSLPNLEIGAARRRKKST
jgi:AraC-like DNA-binding protein